MELGSGLGVTAATFLHIGASIVCTDGEETVVTQLQENLLRNFSPAQSSCPQLFDSVQHLWGEDISRIADSHVLRSDNEQV